MSSTKDENDLNKDPAWFLINLIMHTEAKKLEKVRHVLSTLTGSTHLTDTNFHTTPDRLEWLHRGDGHQEQRSRVSHPRRNTLFEANLPQCEAVRAHHGFLWLEHHLPP
jgi:hypothetical protein